MEELITTYWSQIVMVGAFVYAFATMRGRINNLEGRLDRREGELTKCLNQIMKDMGDVKVDIAEIKGYEKARKDFEHGDGK